MKVPQISIPLVADMSSNIMSERFNVADYGLIYAGAQKNIGPAGVTIVIVRDDLIGRIPNLPTMLDYKTHADKVNNCLKTIILGVNSCCIKIFQLQSHISSLFYHRKHYRNYY